MSVSGGRLAIDKRRWYSLTLRHLRMSTRLRDGGFADGAAFHIYHAYECVVSAFIASQGFLVPPEGRVRVPGPRGTSPLHYRGPAGSTFTERNAHIARFTLFSKLADQTKGYAATHNTLSTFLTYSDRNPMLYYDAQLGRLPHDLYNRAWVDQAYPVLRQFTHEVWRDIR